MALINTQIKPFTATAYKAGEFVQVSGTDLKGKWSVFWIASSLQVVSLLLQRNGAMRGSSLSDYLTPILLMVMSPVGSPIMVYWILPMVSEESCQALWVKCVSVDTE